MKKGKVNINKSVAKFMLEQFSNISFIEYLDTKGVPYKEPGFDFRIVTTPNHVELRWVVKQTHIPIDMDHFLKGMIW